MLATRLTPSLPLWLQRPHAGATCFTVGFDRQDGPPDMAVSMPMVCEGGVWFMQGADGMACERPSTKDVLAVMQMGRCEPQVCEPVYAGMARLSTQLLHARQANTGETCHRLILLMRWPPGRVVCPTSVASHAQVATALAHWLQRLSNGQLRQDRLVPALWTGILAPSAGSSFRLALASCQYPGGVFDSSPRQPLADLSSWAGPADQSAMLLRQHCLDTQRPVDLVVLTGDQVYVDATAGMFNTDPLRPQDPWLLAYRQRSRNLAWHALCGAIVGKGLVMLDDHEIEDNWYEQTNPDATGFDKGQTGVSHFRQEQTFSWPTPAPAKHLWCDVSSATPWPVFLADTRSERQPRTLSNLQQVHIMQNEQRHALEAWVARAAQAGTPHFLVSSSAVLPRLRRTAHEPAMALYEDNWVGYPASLHWLLQTLWTHRASNVVLLAGDEHVSSTCSIRLQRAGELAMTVHAIHSSALYAPYPFANTSPKDLAQPDDRFALPMAGGDLLVDTHTVFYPGDGFALLETNQQGSRWTLQVSFVKAHDRPTSTVSVHLDDAASGTGF